MTPQQISSKLQTRANGQFYTVKVSRPCKVLKDSPSITKVSSLQGILCEYSSRAPIKAAIKNNERDAPQLPRGMKECFKIGRTKFFRGQNNQEYLSVVVSGNKFAPKYFIGDKEISDEEAQKYLAASEKQEFHGEVEFKMVKVENVADIT